MAAYMEIVEGLQKELICGICRMYFSQPVTIDCGHSFCRACLSRSWRVEAMVFSCPECRQLCQIRQFPELNVSLEKLTDIGSQLSSYLLQRTKGQPQCPIHQKVVKLFCEEDQALLCVLCSQTPEHGTHMLCPLEEAAHNYRGKLQKILSDLEKDFEQAEKLHSQVNGKGLPVLEGYPRIIAQYHDLHLFLVKEEFQCLKRWKEEQRAIKDRLSQHIQILKEIMAKLQQSRHKTIIELLQDFRELFVRSKFVLSQKPKHIISFPVGYPITGMIDIFNKFRVDLTICDYQMLSEDLKSMRARKAWQADPNSDGHFVIAEQSFSSGRQYWEVDVTQIPQWKLGISTTGLQGREHNQDSGPFLFLLCCMKKENNYYFRTYPESELNYEMKDPVPRVGVYLEYDDGTLLFCDVVKCSVIFGFYSIPFTEPVTPTFIPGPPLPGIEAGPMTICPVNSHFCAGCNSSL
ncbi:tripartite motif-containing protein 43-like [Macrotis lagotis]|uniref:tripartite motif-containing protein 43-like n=1 Tax=Macrotis lagotis TaxID=92651 RepID=UPI003D694311